MVTREEQRAEASGLVLAVAQEMGDDWSVMTLDGWPVMVGPGREHIRGVLGWYGPERKRLVLEGLWPSFEGGEITWAAKGDSMSVSLMVNRPPGQTRTPVETAADVRRRLLPRYQAALEGRLEAVADRVLAWDRARMLREAMRKTLVPIGSTRIERDDVIAYNPASGRPNVKLTASASTPYVRATIDGMTPDQARALAEFLTTL